jgi:TRAP-type C4-dicarboxylate transport system permease small subunit
MIFDQANENHEAKNKPRVPLIFEDILAALIMAALASITFANVLVRYFTDRSFAWTEEISIFLMIALALVAGAGAFARNHHIRIEFFVQRMSSTKQWLLAQLSCLMGALLFAIIAVLSARLVWDDYRYEEISPGIGVPQWWYSVWLPILSIVIALRIIGLWVRVARAR